MNFAIPIACGTRVDARARATAVGGGTRSIPTFSYAKRDREIRSIVPYSSLIVLGEVGEYTTRRGRILVDLFFSVGDIDIVECKKTREFSG